MKNEKITTKPSKKGLIFKISSNFKNKPYDIKFIWYSILFTLVSVIGAAFLNYFWYRLTGGQEILKLDGQTFVGVFALALGLPIAVVGAWAAIKIARLANDTTQLAYDIQKRQFLLETKIHVFEVITPTKQSIVNLSHSLNELFSSTKKHLIENETLLDKYIRETYQQLDSGNSSSIPVSSITLSQELRDRIALAEKGIYDALLGILEALDAIRKDSKSYIFWEWQFKRRNIFNNNASPVALFIQENISKIVPEKCSKELINYLRTKEGVGGIHYVGMELIFNFKKAYEKHLKMTDTDFIKDMVNLYESPLLYKTTNRTDASSDYDSGRLYLEILKKNSNAAFLQEEAYNTEIYLIVDFILELIRLMPTKMDIDNFILEGPFDSWSNSQDKDKLLLNSFNPNVLNSEVNAIKCALEGSCSEILYKSLNIIRNIEISHPVIEEATPDFFIKQAKKHSDAMAEIKPELILKDEPFKKSSK